MADTLLTARERELYINVVQSINPLPDKASHDLAPRIVDWLSYHMPEELEDGKLDPHAVDVALVHLGLREP